MTSSRWYVELTRTATRDLRDLRPWTQQALQAILRLETNPQAGHPLAGSLRGARSLEFTLKGSGAYRAVYIVQTRRVPDESGRWTGTCLVFIVGPHENIYEKAELRLEALRRAGEL